MDTVKTKKIQDADSSAKSPSSGVEESAPAPIKYSYQKGKTKKPKRNKSAFILFSVEMRAKLKSDTQDQLNSNEMMVKLANLWKELPKAEREKYHSEAKSDKMRYLQELDNFSKAYPSESIHNKTKKNHVKKPCSSYAIFLKEMKGIIKEKSPDLKMADVLKIVSEKWKNLKEDEKLIYQDRAKMEKELARAKLGESLQKGNTPNNISNESLATHKKIKTQSDRPNPYLIKDSKHSQGKIEGHNNRLNILETVLSSKTSIPGSDISTKADTPGLEGLARSFDFPFLSMGRSQSSQLSQLSSHLNDKRLSIEAESQLLMSLYDQGMMKSRELLVDLMSFNLPTERFDTLDLFEKVPTMSNINGNSGPVIPKPSYSNGHGLNEGLLKNRGFPMPLHELLNNTIIEALRTNNQNNDVVQENINKGPIIPTLSFVKPMK